MCGPLPLLVSTKPRPRLLPGVLGLAEAVVSTGGAEAVVMSRS